jgi:hypothetical protein
MKTIYNDPTDSEIVVSDFMCDIDSNAHLVFGTQKKKNLEKGAH